MSVRELATHAVLSAVAFGAGYGVVSVTDQFVRAVNERIASYGKPRAEHLITYVCKECNSKKKCSGD